jgi:hypothetical protein
MVTACKMDLEMEEFGAQLSQRRNRDHLTSCSGFNHTKPEIIRLHRVR